MLVVVEGATVVVVVGATVLGATVVVVAVAPLLTCTGWDGLEPPRIAARAPAVTDAPATAPAIAIFQRFMLSRDSRGAAEAE